MIVLVISKIDYGFSKFIINATVFMIEISSEKKTTKKKTTEKNFDFSPEHLPGRDSALFVCVRKLLSCIQLFETP